VKFPGTCVFSIVDFFTADKGQEEHLNIAKGDQVNTTQKFLKGAIPLVQAKPEKIQWYGVKFTDVDSPMFAIFDTFNSKDDQNTHLNGKDAGALFANADTLFVADPVVNKVNVLASKVCQL
jgi:hypothetical protein